MTQQLMIDGETAGILSSCESQLPLVPGAMGRPVRTVNFVRRTLDLPLAKNACVWYKVAYGITVRDEWLSNSAEMAVDSPGNRV